MLFEALHLSFALACYSEIEWIAIVCHPRQKWMSSGCCRTCFTFALWSAFILYYHTTIYGSQQQTMIHTTRPQKDFIFGIKACIILSFFSEVPYSTYTKYWSSPTDWTICPIQGKPPKTFFHATNPRRHLFVKGASPSTSISNNRYPTLHVFMRFRYRSFERCSKAQVHLSMSFGKTIAIPAMRWGQMPTSSQTHWNLLVMHLYICPWWNSRVSKLLSLCDYRRNRGFNIFDNLS